MHEVKEEGDVQMKGQENLFREITAENCQDLEKDIDI
jgi:hypothetical protein